MGRQWMQKKRETNAAKKGKVATKLVRDIAIAAKSGADPAMNARLAVVLEAARKQSVSSDTIQRAIKRGIGEEEGVIYESVNYEGYAPNGVAVYVQCLTDNRNRTGSEVKNIFTKNGGSFAEPGAVAWQFDRKGQVFIAKEAIGEDDLTLLAADAGAEDIHDFGDEWQVLTPATELHVVRTAIEEAGIPVKSGDLTMIPSSTINLDQEAAAKQVLRLVDALEDHDDVEAVYANFDIPESVLEAVSQ